MLHFSLSQATAPFALPKSIIMDKSLHLPPAHLSECHTSSLTAEQRLCESVKSQIAPDSFFFFFFNRRLCDTTDACEWAATD